MRHKIFVSLVCVSLLSCATKEPIPISYHCSVIQLPDDPISPVGALTRDSRPDEVIKAWVATAYAYRGWNRAVRKQIEDSES
jgi:hypothetical protein